MNIDEKFCDYESVIVMLYFLYELKTVCSILSFE